MIISNDQQRLADIRAATKRLRKQWGKQVDHWETPFFLRLYDEQRREIQRLTNLNKKSIGL